MEATTPAGSQLARIATLCDEVGLAYVELESHVMASGLAVGFSETDYIVLSILSSSAGTLYLTNGVLRNISQDRSQALELANGWTRANPSYPAFLHDADAGWALLIQQSYSIQLLLDIPPFFDSCIRGAVSICQQRRDEAQTGSSIGGSAWTWTPDEHRDLMIRSVL